MNHLVEIVAVDTASESLQSVKKLSKEEYLRLDTGEIGKYNLSENRLDNKESLTRTFRNIKDIINNNFTGERHNEKHYILTYKENMTDPVRLAKDRDKFIKRYKRKYPDAEIFWVVEPQGRGAWHIHVIVKHQNEFYMSQQELWKLWSPKGQEEDRDYVKVKKLVGNDNIGVYLTSYLGDLVLPDGEDPGEATYVEKVIDGKSKRVMKGERCKLYPPGMNIFGHSKGIWKPEVQVMPYEDIKRIIGSATPDYSMRTEIVKDDEWLGKAVYVNGVTKEYYNTKRQKAK